MASTPPFPKTGSGSGSREPWTAERLLGSTGPDPEPQPSVLDSLVRVLHRRKWWVIQAVVIVPLIIAGLTLTQHKKYTATANILFHNAAANVLGDTTNAPTSDPIRDAATAQSLIELPVVAQRAAALIGHGVTASDVVSAVSVSDNSDNSDLAAISAVSTDPALAAQMANAYGAAYIQFRKQSDRQQLQQAIDLARGRLAALSPTDQAGTPGSNLRDQLNRLLLAQSLLTGDAELVQRASAPVSPSSPKLKRNVILGVLLGAVLGLGLGGLRERFDRSIKDERELEEVYRVPVLARVPRSRKLGDLHTREIEHSPEAEPFRMLRTNLRYFDVDGRLRSLLVSSPMSGDGKSTVARALAVTMASVGDHVVLVEADLRKATSPTLNGRTPARGLSSVLSGTPLEDALVRVPVEAADESATRYLTLLPSGPVPPNPLELMESGRMASLLAELEHRFELVIVDSPALSHVGDARPLVGMVSGILIVSAIGHTTRPAALDFRKQLDLLEGKPLGVLENLAPALRGGSYY